MDKKKKITICSKGVDKAFFFNGLYRSEIKVGDTVFWVFFDEQYNDDIYINISNIIWWKYKKSYGGEK